MTDDLPPDEDERDEELASLLEVPPLDDVTRERLVTRAVDGDRRALELLLDRHADRIHAVCRRIVAHPEDALDATQEAMIAVARGIARFDGRAAFSTWCYRVATNAALDELRRKRRRPRHATFTSVPSTKCLVSPLLF